MNLLHNDYSILDRWIDTIKDRLHLEIWVRMSQHERKPQSELEGALAKLPVRGALHKWRSAGETDVAMAMGCYGDMVNNIQP